MNTVFPQDAQPERLDTALARTLGVSRAQAQRAIKEGRVFVNGIAAKAHLMLQPGAAIKVTEESIEQDTTPRVIPDLDILFEDNDVLVINKPAGLLVHPTAAAQKPVTLIESILKYAPHIRGVGGDPMRSGIVHRLDREASGVMIVAKNERAHRFLKEQFKTRKTDKRYTVLVLGKVADEAGTIDFPIARSSTRARMAARPHSQEGKEAVSHYDVKQRFTTTTLLDVHIETGRTHQIRAHFFAIGHPVAGDKLYVRRGLKPLALDRLFLHARELSLTLPNGEHKTFSAPLPPQLTQVLSELKPLL